MDWVRNVMIGQNAILEKKGFRKFGVICTEDEEEKGLCYQHEGRFVFVNYNGEIIIRPLLICKDEEAEFEIYKYRLLREKYNYPNLLLEYDNYDFVYRVCNPSTEKCCSIYYKDGKEYYILTHDNKCIPVDLSSFMYFEYIDKPLYIHLSFHTIDEDVDLYDNRYSDYYSKDVFFNKKKQCLFTYSELISYKNYLIVNCQNPTCTVVFDDKMDEMYKQEESAVFVRFGNKAYLIFEDLQMAYDLDLCETKSLEDLEQYDNYDVFLNYLIRYRVTSYQKEELWDNPNSEYIEWIPKHDITNAFIYNSNLSIIKELKVAGLFYDIVNKEGRIMIHFYTEEDESHELYYDINGENKLEFDENIRKTISVPDLIEVSNDKPQYLFED